MDARHPSYWERDLPPAPPPPRDLPAAVDVLIVGAGFMGRWLAWFLARQVPAPRILVVERDGFGYGASTRNAGFLTCGQVSEMLADARAVGEAAVVANFLARREGLDLVRHELPGVAREDVGSADFDPLTDEKRALAGRLNEAAGETIFSVQDTDFGGTRRPVLWNAVDAGVQPVVLLRALEEGTPGARYAYGVEALGLDDGRARLRVGHTVREVAYGRGFVCTNGLAPRLDRASPVVPGRGQVIVTAPVRTPPAAPLGYLRDGYDYFRFVDGRLLVGGGRDRFPAEQGTDALAVTEEVRRHLQQTAATILGHADVAVEHHWAGLMGFVGGSHLGGSPRRRLDARTEAVAGFGGMGVALAPYEARRIASEG